MICSHKQIYKLFFVKIYLCFMSSHWQSVVESLLPVGLQQFCLLPKSVLLFYIEYDCCREFFDQYFYLFFK